MRRKDREKDHNFAVAVIDKAEYAVMAMVDVEGEPYCVPLSVVRNGEWLYFHSAKAGRKVECLQEKPEVWLTFVGNTELAPEEYSTFFESAMVKGRAVEVVDVGEKKTALYAICKKYAPNHLEAFDRALEESLAVTGIWKIHMDRITGKAKEKR